MIDWTSSNLALRAARDHINAIEKARVEREDRDKVGHVKPSRVIVSPFVCHDQHGRPFVQRVFP